MSHDARKSAGITFSHQQGHQVSSVDISQSVQIVHESIFGPLQTVQIGVQKPRRRIRHFLHVNQTQLNLDITVGKTKICIIHRPRDFSLDGIYAPCVDSYNRRISHQEVDQVSISISPTQHRLSSPPWVSRQSRSICPTSRATVVNRIVGFPDKFVLGSTVVIVALPEHGKGCAYHILNYRQRNDSFGLPNQTACPGEISVPHIRPRVSFGP